MTNAKQGATIDVVTDIVTTSELETLAWWVNPATFTTKLADFNKDAKQLGDSALPPAIAAYLNDQEVCQSRESSGIPARRSQTNPGTTP